MSDEQARKVLEEGTKPNIDFGKLRTVYEKIILTGGRDVIPVVVQDADTLLVLIVAYINKEALDYALESGIATFWSTSRDELWIKGKTSGDTLALIEVRVNCDQNSLLFLVKPVAKGACHTRGAGGTARESCYYRRIVVEDGVMMLDHI
jgi:phosphoribosyl-AMP cyclohydrolase